MSNENQDDTNKDIKQTLASTFPSGFQAIATAYGDYTKRSFEDTKSFVEKMSGVKSFEKAFEIQTEFAKTAYETFVSEFAEDRRDVWRSCQAILQAIRWLCCEGDPGRSVRPTFVTSKLPCSSRGIFECSCSIGLFATVYFRKMETTNISPK